MMSLGPSFRLVRDENELLGKDVQKATGINVASLTRFERGRENLSEEKIDSLKKLYGLVDVSESSIVTIQAGFEAVFNGLFYLDRSYREEFQKLSNMQNEIASTVYYPLYYIYAFCVTVQDNAAHTKIKNEKVEAQLNELKMMILKAIEGIPANWKALFYDYQGEEYRYRYEYKKALEFYAEAKNHATKDQQRGLIEYHIALAYAQMGATSNALIPLAEAKKHFITYMNFERLLGAEYLHGTLYQDIRNYDEALNYFKRCLYITKKGVYQLTEDFVMNNILWMYIMKKDYYQVIEWGKRALELENYKNYAHLYMSWAYYELGDEDRAIWSLNESKMNFPGHIDETDEKQFSLMEMIIKNASMSKINSNYQRMIKSIQYTSIDTKLFVYQMMETYYRKQGDESKQFEFRKLYLEEFSSVGTL